MKGVLVVLDGMGDLPCKQLDEKTPLEAAEMPNLDFLAARGEMGYMYTVKPNFVPTSDEATVSIFGNELSSSSRGQLEAIGADMKLVRGDLALRADFATVGSLKESNLIDRRSGRTITTAETEILSKAINKIKLPCEFTFKPTIQYRGVLVLRGGFSDNVTGNDAHYLQSGKIGEAKIVPFRALDEEENSQYTVNILREFVEKAFEVLDKHPINIERKRKGLLPANYLLLRGPGVETPKLRFYRRWMAVSPMPMENGFAKASGMKVFTFEYPTLKSLDAYENLYDGLQKTCEFAIKTLKKNHTKFDYAYIHIKEIDTAGHDNKPIEKKEMIEYVDKTLFKFLKDFAPANRVRVAVTADHSTPCKLKEHSADPVPVLLYNISPPKKKEFRFKSLFGKFNNVYQKKNADVKIIGSESEEFDLSTRPIEAKAEKFCEKNARNGKLGMILGKDLLEKLEFNK